MWIILWKTSGGGCKIMQDKENLNAWLEILRDIKKKVDQNSFETWFEPTLYIGQEKDVLYIKVPNSYFRDWLSFHYSSLIGESSEALFGKAFEIKYIFDETPGPFMRRSPEDRRKSAEAGFHDYLVKPVEYDAMRRVLEETQITRT